jgi:hypothetical protein
MKQQCEFRLESTVNNPVNAGQEFTITIARTAFSPPPAGADPLQPGCTFEVFIDGNKLALDTDVGDFHCTGLGAKGTASFRVLKDNPKRSKFAFVLKCPDCGPTPEYIWIPTGAAKPVKNGCATILQAIGKLGTIKPK